MKSERELASYLKRKINSALNDDGDEISARRERNMAYYRGDLYGNERDGQSKIVTRECLEAVEWAMPSVVRALVHPGAVTFEPVGPEDEQAADQETDVVRHHLFERGNGFVSLHNWCKDSLMYPTGYCKLWVEPVSEVSTERYHGLTQNQVVMLTQEEGVEITGQAERQDPELGAIYDIEVKRSVNRMNLRFEAVPPEEVLVDSDHTCTDLDDSEFVAHKVNRTLSDLVELGYDPERLKQIGADDDYDGAEEQSRSLFSETDDDDEEANREFTVYECYVLVDTDGDDIAERRRVVLIGNEIFENEEADYVPLVAMSALLMPHQHTGMSLIDLVADLQEANSALMRQLMTNVYRTNVPRKYVGTRALVDGGMTLDNLLNMEAEIIPVEDPSQIVPEPIQPIAQTILPVIQQVDSMKQLRTGINPQLALDPKVLRDTTMGQFNAALDSASQRIELIVRVMAETGIKQVFKKAHRLIREHLGQSTAVRLRNAWVDVSPSEWRERNNLNVKVGVGNQSKAEKAQNLQMVMGVQMQAMQMGMPFVTPQNLFNTLSELVQAHGFRDAGKFFMDPATIPPPQPPPPDPMQELAKAQAQSLMMEAQAKMQKAQMEGQKMQLEAQLEQARMQMEQARMQMEQGKAQLEAYKAQQALEQAREASMLDYQIKMAELSGKEADKGLKEAQRVKTLEEARKLDIENDAAETGVTVAAVMGA